MIIRGIERLRRTARRAGRRYDKKVLILLYHRVAKLNSDPWGSSVAPSHLAEQLEALRQCPAVMTLQQLFGASFEDLPDLPVIITFDDGYAADLHSAAEGA